MRWEVKEVRPLRRVDYSGALTLYAHFGERALLRDAELVQSVVIGTNPFVQEYSKRMRLEVRQKSVPAPVATGYSVDEALIGRTWLVHHSVKTGKGKTEIEDTVSVRRLDDSIAREHASYNGAADLEDFLFLDDLAMLVTGTRRGDNVLVLPEPTFKSEPVATTQPKKTRLSYIQ